jgi:hypothetical protein
MTQECEIIAQKDEIFRDARTFWRILKINLTQQPLRQDSVVEKIGEIMYVRTGRLKRDIK